MEGTDSKLPNFTVWTRFKVKLADGTESNLLIQDLPPGKEEEAADFMIKNLCLSETWNKTFGMHEDLTARLEMKELYKGLFLSTSPLLCVVDCKDDILEIVGMNALASSKKNDPLKFEIKNDRLNKLFDFIDSLNSICPIYEKYSVEEFLSGAGLFVCPKYRGCGIATELLKARLPFCKKLGIPVTAVWLTSYGSQRAAEKAGYERLLTVSYEDFGRLHSIKFLNECPDFTLDSLLCV